MGGTSGMSLFPLIDAYDHQRSVAATGEDATAQNTSGSSNSSNSMASTPSLRSVSSTVINPEPSTMAHNSSGSPSCNSVVVGNGGNLMLNSVKSIATTTAMAANASVPSQLPTALTASSGTNTNNSSNSLHQHGTASSSSSVETGMQTMNMVRSPQEQRRDVAAAAAAMTGKYSQRKVVSVMGQ